MRPARRLVLEALAAADGPVPAETVAAGIGGRVPRSDLASVYRNLGALEAAGVVTHMHAGRGPGLYALAGRELTEYVACETCGEIAALDPKALEPVRTAARELLGYEVRFSHFPLTGVCPRCASAGRGPSGRAAQRAGRSARSAPAPG